MNEELKPCPFCGKQPKLFEGRYSADSRADKPFTVRCVNCGGGISMMPEYGEGNYWWRHTDEGYAHMREIVTNAWNTRYEPTCTMEKVLLYDEECVEGIECDECGWSEIHDHSEPIPYTHCPNCKAKVEA